mmetsp:Transcript_63572/g.176822  ORF Transcript_63572/g.176822 Transcript_63572/m.176822 type:complete len:248 (-) Transcript_63572:156-899(-)
MATWSCSFTTLRASSVFSNASATSFSTDSRTDAGVAKASTASSANEVIGSAAFSTAFVAASADSTFGVAAPVIASASFRSFASMCAFNSAFSLVLKAVLPVMIWLLSSLILAMAVATCGWNLAISSFDSLMAAVGDALHSVNFVFTNPEILYTPASPSFSAFSIAAQNKSKGATGCTYMAPWFPFTVTQHSLPSLRSLQAARYIWESSSLATLVSSTSSPGSTLPTVLLSAIEKPSVTEMPLLTTPR